MKSSFLDHLDNRTSKFSRNIKLDELLDELRDVLEPVDKKMSSNFSHPKFPPLFLIGNPRSGTTFVMQLLNTTNQFAVPTNFLSRFYYAPYLGAKFQQLLTDKNFDYNNELGDLGTTDEFSSSLGKTAGALEPSEFFHFWRRFLPNYDPQWLSSEEEEKIDFQGLAAGFASIEAVLQRPIAAKAIILQYNLPKLYETFSTGIFVFVRRNPLFVMQSIYQARKDFYNSLDIWWSVKPKEFSRLERLDIYSQIAGQVYFTEQALNAGLSQLSEKNKLITDYEKVCQDPAEFYTSLTGKYSEHGYELSGEATLPQKFVPSNKIRIPDSEYQSLVNAYESFRKNPIETHIYE